VAVAESAPQANKRSVCVIRTVVEQHFNWYRASRRSLSDSWASCFYQICALRQYSGIFWKLQWI